MSIVDEEPNLGTSGLIGEDIDGDGALDLVSFGYNGTTSGSKPGEIYWYHYEASGGAAAANTSWTRRLITRKPNPVHGDFIDVDGDGHRDLIFFSDFTVPIRNASTDGSIWWAKRPSTDSELLSPQLRGGNGWEVWRIGRSLGAHRIAAVPDLDGSGAAWGVLVVPLVNPGAFPTYGPSPVTLYVPGSNPRRPWRKTVSAELLHVSHDVLLVPGRSAAAAGTPSTSRAGKACRR